MVPGLHLIPPVVLVAIAGLAVLSAAAELSTRWWLRRRGAYYVLPPGLRLPGGP